MANENKGKGQAQRSENRGLNKSHVVYDAQGNPIEGGMTQTEWKNRDKGAGLTRDEPATETVEEAPAEGAAEGEAQG